MKPTAAERDLLSCNRLCELFQVLPREIERAASRAHVEPALRMNGQAWFAEPAAKKIQAELRKAAT